MAFAGGGRGDRMLELMAEMRCTEAQGENCLVLNVWQPMWSDSTARPVMVSLHGGAFTICSGSMPVYDGAALAARHDVVVVSVNHRLGALGYLYLADVLGEEYAASGNVGNLDLVAALQWVQANAAGFGGDPSNVTIFGESGGGGKVSTLLAMPDAAGLFHRAIVQSGPKLRALDPDAAAKTTHAVLDELGLSEKPQGLLTVPAEAIVAAQLRVLGGPLDMGPRKLGPVVDGGVLPCHPFDPDAPAVSAGIPLLIGTTKDEMTLFTYPDETLDTLDDSGAVAAVTPIAGDWAQDMYDLYARTRPDVSPVRRVAAIMTDRFRVGSIRLAERKAAADGAPVWMYRFDFETDVESGALGAPHAIDIAFTFANADASALSGSRPERYAVADVVSGVWATFARTGSPQTTDLPSWSPYDTQHRATMLLDTTSRIVEDPDSTERTAWDNVAIAL
jgi:para-nitrobenzyl esterase